MFAVVLVLQHRVRGPQPRLEQTVGGPALGPGTVGIPAPGDIGAGQVVLRLPALFVDQRLQTRPVSARHGAEHPVGRHPQRVVPAQCHRVLLDPGGERVVGRRFVQGGHGAHGGIEQVDQARKGVAEKARDTQRHVDAGTTEDGDGQNLEPGDPAGRAVPLRLDPQQGEGLGDVVAARAHVGRAPGGNRDGFRPVAVVLGVTFDQQARGLPAQLPGGRGRHRAGVDGIEIAPRGQHVRASPRRRARGTRRHEAAVQARQHALCFRGTRSLNGRAQMILNKVEHGGRRGPGRVGSGVAGDQSRRQNLQPLHHVARRAPGGVRIVQYRRARVTPGGRHVAVEGVEIPAQAQIRRQGPQQRGVFRSAPARHPGQGHQQVRQQATLGRDPQNVQAVADLHFLELTQIIVELGQLVAGGIVRRHAAVGADARGGAEREDIRFQHLQAAAVDPGGLVIFIDQRLQVLQGSVAFGAGQGRGQMVDDDGGGPALGLGALARVVDDEGVDVGERPQGRFGKAILRQGQGLARQPFQIAVLAHMDHGVGAEGFA